MSQFEKPREEINSMLNEMMSIVENLVVILETKHEKESMSHALFKDFLKLMLDKINNYKFTLMRNYLKCVFIGRTSNGKSSIINAIINKTDLPMGIGHTTNCCILIRCSERKDAYIEHFTSQNQQRPASIHSLDKLKNYAHALSKNKLNSDDTIQVNYPSNSCPIIKPNVYFVDSPGIDIETDFDLWIEKYCFDADLFVMVCNAESILMQCEKNIFHKVKNQFLMPKILIVNNRWDVSVDQPKDQVERVKQQQMKTFSDFLSKELKVYTEEDVKEKVFFVSAQEELKGQRDGEDLSQIPGRDERKEEFIRLVKTLENYLSPDALNQKLAANFIGMEKVFEELNSFVNCLFNTVIIEKDMIKKNLTEQNNYFKSLEEGLPKINQKASEYIENMMTKAKNKIASDFQDLVCGIDLSTNTIDVTFNPYNRNEYLEYQKFLVENLENFLICDLNSKTIRSLNDLLKSGSKKLTLLYTEGIILKHSTEQHKLPPVSACQPPIPQLYPKFSPIMNSKVSKMKEKIKSIPDHFMNVNLCIKYLDSFDGRFVTHSKFTSNDVSENSSKLSLSSSTKLPEITLMVPKFSSLIMSDFSFTSGFHFTLSPNNIRNFWLQWSQSCCPLKSKLRAISMKNAIFCSLCGGICYKVIRNHGKLWKQAVCVFLGMYFLLLGYERYYWDVNAEMMSLKNQFIHHCKVKMESIVYIAAVTTSRQFSSFLKLDLRGLEKGIERMINDFHVQIEQLIDLEADLLINEKKLKKIKSSMHVMGQQITAFRKNMFDKKYGILK